MTIRPESSAPTQVGRYALLTRLGEGGMGIVHLAQGPDGQRVALKVLRPQVVGDQEARHRLAREVGSLTRVRSPWVAEMLDADPWAEVPYVVTRYVPGLSLHGHVAAEGPIAGRDLLWLAGCLAEGLAAVHGAGVLHRDVKPGNVLMEGRTPILIDFGLARVADDIRLTQTGWLLGTPGYLAPEILYGDEATPAADVHAWAATVAYAASGRAPYGRGPAMAVMDRTRRGQHDLTGIESPLAEVLAAALDPEPLERPLLEELLAWLRPLSTRPELPPVPPPSARVPPSPVVDDVTLPLALAGQGSGPVAPGPVTPPTVPDPAAPGTRALPTEVGPPTSLPPMPAPPLQSVPPLPPLPPPPAAAMTRMEEQFDQEWDPEHPFAPQPRPPLAERIRRWVAVGLGAVALGAGFAAAPWVATAVVVLAVWLLRAGSLATSAVADRRTVRGAKWYDGLRWLTTSPWHLIRGVTGTVVLVTWSAGLGVAAGLLGYALQLDVPTTLLACGATLGLALWSGPGSTRFRLPISRVLDPLARRPVPWLLACAVLLAVAGGLGALAAGNGVSWTPWSSGPFGL
ncbi:serine/threonine protein kinase [Nocardioides carbamazepini]|uniref:serine/threonine-protein kinase n=1 Tax=Nocardioides carbamazepini TaxID=2854259 RepID=UPI002149E4D4|nr:serine/threonine-protein kinase [Nocardioides carbamazepini]MCR1782585.1 serine/threonine protein kinase [Nocardioides carbamazepini]